MFVIAYPQRLKTIIVLITRFKGILSLELFMGTKGRENVKHRFLKIVRNALGVYDKMLCFYNIKISKYYKMLAAKI